MKKLLLLCCAVLYTGAAWGMAKAIFSSNNLGSQKKENLSEWFKTIDETTLPKAKTADLGRLFSVLSLQDDQWIAELLNIDAFKRLLSLQDNEGNTLLHHMAESGDEELLRNVIPLLPTTLRTLKNNAGQTPYQLYIDNNGEDEDIQKLLDPSSGSSKSPATTSLKDFNAENLSKITTREAAQTFIDELNEKSVPTTGDVIELTQFTLSQIKDFETLKILLKSPKLEPLWTAKNADNSETILHVFADRNNVTADEIQLLLDLGIDRNAERITRLSRKTAADLYKEHTQDPAVAKLLKPTSPSKKASSKIFDLSDLKKATTEAAAHDFVDSLDETSVPTSGSSTAIRDIHNALAGITDANALKVLLDSTKLLPALRAKDQFSEKTVLHVFAAKPDVTVGQIKTLIGLGINKNNVGKTASGAEKTAADIYRDTHETPNAAIEQLLKPDQALKKFDVGAINKNKLSLDEIDPKTVPDTLTNSDTATIALFDPEKLEALLKHPATAHLIHTKNTHGELIIHEATHHASADVRKDIVGTDAPREAIVRKIRILVDYGSDLTAKDKNGETPLEAYSGAQRGLTGTMLEGKNSEILKLLTPRPLDTRIATFAEALYTLSDEIGGPLGLGTFD